MCAASSLSKTGCGRTPTPSRFQSRALRRKGRRIAWANRGKDPSLLFAALHRQLGYPSIPRPEPIEQTTLILPQLMRRVERMESRLKLLEEEQKGGIDLSKFYNPPKLSADEER